MERGEEREGRAEEERERRERALASETESEEREREARCWGSEVDLSTGITVILGRDELTPLRPLLC
jgi:hypothetical protein